jgi:hypothetical protein
VIWRFHPTRGHVIYQSPEEQTRAITHLYKKLYCAKVSIAEMSFLKSPSSLSSAKEEKNRAGNTNGMDVAQPVTLIPGM